MGGTGTSWVEMAAMTVMWMLVDRAAWDLSGAPRGPTRRVLRVEDRSKPHSSML